MFNFRDTNSTYLHYRTIALLNEIEPYYILTVVAVGLLGNSISFGIFLSSRSKKKESNYILASLGLVDNIFLITLTLVNLRHVGIDPFNHYKYVCKLTVYLTFVCGFLSVWLVTLFSIERFIAVMFPLHRFSICNRKRNQLSIFVLVLFALIFYSFYFVTTGIEADIEHPSVTQCIAYEKWVDTVKTMNFVDIMLTIVMPFIIIFIINISISLKLTRFSFLERFKTNVTSPTTRATSKSPSHNHQNHHHHHRHNQRLSSWSSIRNYGLCNGSAATARSSVSSTEERVNIVKGDEAKENNNNNNKKQSLISSALAINTSSTPLPHQVLLMAACSTYRRKRFKSYSRTTRMLIIISATYIMLNALMAYLKLRHLFEPYFISDDQHHLEERKRLNNELLERASCYLYYLNFSINFFLYVLNKSTFTDILFDLFKRRSKSTSTAATKV